MGGNTNLGSRKSEGLLVGVKLLYRPGRSLWHGNSGAKFSKFV